MSAFRAGTGEPLVLPSVFANPWHKWEPVLPLLTAEYDVLVPTLPGFAPDLPLEGPASIGGLASGVASVMDRIGWDTAHIIGNSMGAWVAMELGRLGRARSVGAFSPAGGYDDRRRVVVRRFFHRNRLLTRAFSPFMPLAYRSSFIRRSTMSAVVARPQQLTRSQAVDIARDTMGPAWRDLRPIFDERLQPYPDLGVPTLIAWSEKDRLTPLRSDGETWRAMAPAAEFRVLPGVGHVPTYDDPDLSARTIQERTARAS